MTASSLSRRNGLEFLKLSRNSVPMGMVGLLYNTLGFGLDPVSGWATSLLGLTPTLAQRTFWTDMMLVLGVVMITAWLFSRLRKRRLTQARQPTVQEQIERNRQQRGLRGDLEDLMVEIEQLAKRLGAQLDAKSFHIEKLMREADRRIARLERMQPQSHATIDPRPLNTEAATKQPVGAAAATDPPAPQSPHHNEAAAGENDPLVRSIYDLADQGVNATDIARQLNEHLGKVELILALRES